MFKLKIGSFEVELDSYGLLIAFCTITIVVGILASAFGGK